ncbi:hypothetical protein F511_34521 [Dorcoceras hygrometricum]|uniref:Uncharacterized protein n=1 Tax=Dorcoceras hygrometricum TaxID=472368 RepID=A0A2Z7BLS5_9LAMI|nr:hypothetical protein F511_34521 [Dorcoceras hygrometricum]
MAQLGARLVALSSPSQDASFYTSFAGLGGLKERTRRSYSALSVRIPTNWFFRSAQKLRYGLMVVLQLWDKLGYMCMLAGMLCSVYAIVLMLLTAISVLVIVFQVIQLAVVVSRLVMPPEIPPRGRGRARRQIPLESEAQNEVVERSIPIPVHRHARRVEDEVDLLAAHVDEMELIMERFQRMNHQTFNDDESSSDADSWLQHITGLFDRVR